MRYDKIDITRWIAILMMIIFHINYSLLFIFWINFLNFSDIFWNIFWKISWILFIVISGISFLLSEKKHGNNVRKKYLRYSFFLLIISIIITWLTYVFLRKQLILFWILHFFSISFFLMIYIRKLKYLNLFIWLIISIIPFFINLRASFNYLFFVWLRKNDFYSADYWPLIPYFWIFLISYSISYYLYEKQILQKILSWEKKSFTYNTLKYMWKNSLLIYLIHQPIIILLIYIIKYI